MESDAEIPRDTPVMRAGNGRGTVQLLTRSSLDGRTKESKLFDAIAEGIAGDLGGEDRLSTVQRELIEAFAGSAIALRSINARMLLGEEVAVADQSSAASTLLRLAQRIGIGRVPRDVTPTLDDIVREIEAEKRDGGPQRL